MTHCIDADIRPNQAVVSNTNFCKRVACLVTGAFPSCIGRKQTINYIKQACELKGAKICGIGSVGWWSFNRSRQISEVVNHLTNCFK